VLEASGCWLAASSWNLRVQSGGQEIEEFGAGRQELETRNQKPETGSQSFSGTMFLSPWQKVATRCSPPSGCGSSLTGPRQ
jgi:hypothetical protein